MRVIYRFLQHKVRPKSPSWFRTTSQHDIQQHNPATAVDRVTTPVREKASTETGGFVGRASGMQSKTRRAGFQRRRRCVPQRRVAAEGGAPWYDRVSQMVFSPVRAVSMDARDDAMPRTRWVAPVCLQTGPAGGITCGSGSQTSSSTCFRPLDPMQLHSYRAVLERWSVNSRR
jgi:hypothetical protein